MTDRPLRIAFLTLTNDDGSDRIVSHMGREGAECAVIGPGNAFAARSRAVSCHAVLPSRGGAWVAARFAQRRIEALAATFAPDLVVPLDDMASHLLRGIAEARRTGESLRTLIARSLGRPEGYAVASSRERIIALAARLGIPTPAQRAAVDRAGAIEAAAALGYPVVLKREQSCGGKGVAVAEDAEALQTAFRSAERTALLKRTVQLALGLGGGASGSLTLQAFVPGTLAMHTVACVDGRVLDGVSFGAERLHPATVGSSTMLRPLDHPAMAAAAGRLVAALGCSGFVSFDFMLTETGEALLIEMNPRPIASGHLGRLVGHDIYGAMAAHLRGRPAPRSPGRTNATGSIALFPKELDRDPRGLCFAAGSGVLHDVPWDEPAVLAAYRDRLLAAHPAHAPAIGRLLAESLPATQAPAFATDDAPQGKRAPCLTAAIQ